MIRGEVEFLADSMLIEKLAWIDPIVGKTIRKEAGMGDTLMGMLDSGISKIKESVSGSVSHLVDTSDTGSIVESVAKLISTGALFSLWPPLGIINAVASEFGLDLVSIAKKIWSLISGSLLNNGSVTPQEVSEATKTVTSQIAGSPSDQKPIGGTDSAQARDRFASWDLLEPLRTLEKRGELHKIAILGGLFNWFFSLPIFKAKSLIGGLVGWALKGALIGAGLMAGAGTITRLVGLKKDEPKPTSAEGAGSEGESVLPKNETVEQPSAPSPKLTPTGRGEKRHPNTADIQWYVPVVGGSVERTLLTWAKDIYQEFNGNYDSIIRNTYGFQKASDELSQAVEYTSNQIKVPNQYKSRKQIVDMFAGQAASKLPNNSSN